MQYLSERKLVLTCSQGYIGGKMGAERRWLEPAVFLLLLEILSNCFQWWRMGVLQTRTAWLWDIPESPALGHFELCNPAVSCPQSGGAPAHGRAISQCGWAAGTGQQECQIPAAVSSYRPGAVAASLSAPTCMSFIPSCGKVNKAYKEENMLPSQPFLLHFSKQFFWLIGRFYFSL